MNDLNYDHFSTMDRQKFEREQYALFQQWIRSPAAGHCRRVEPSAPVTNVQPDLMAKSDPGGREWRWVDVYETLQPGDAYFVYGSGCWVLVGPQCGVLCQHSFKYRRRIDTDAARPAAGSVTLTNEERVTLTAVQDIFQRSYASNGDDSCGRIAAVIDGLLKRAHI